MLNFNHTKFVEICSEINDNDVKIIIKTNITTMF